jgi:serine/threonine-protein kinase
MSAATREWLAPSRRGELIADKYLLGEVLGMGGMGIVYLASHVGLDRAVALKMLRPEIQMQPDVLRRFRNEARAGARLSHANVVSVFDCGATTDGLPYLVM